MNLLPPFATGAVDRRHQIAVQSQVEECVFLHLQARGLEKCRRRSVVPKTQFGRLGVGFVAEAVVAEGELRRVELISDAVENHRRTRRHRHPVNQLQRFLNLQRRHH